MTKSSFDAALADMLRDCALVSDIGRIIDLTTQRVRRKTLSVTSYRRLYAPLAKIGRGPHGGQALVHVVDTWLHHPERKTAYPGDLEYPLSSADWYWLEGHATARWFDNMAGDRPDLRSNPNFRPYVETAEDRAHDKRMEALMPPRQH